MKELNDPRPPLVQKREFKKVRRLQQRKRHFKKALCSRFRVLRLFPVSHVVRNTRSVLSLDFSCKGRELKFTAARSRCRLNFKYRGAYAKTTATAAKTSLQNKHLGNGYYFQIIASSSHPILLIEHAANGQVEAPLKLKLRMKDLLLRVHVVVKTLNLEISRCHLADYVKEL